jgi:Putative MetA-pathway of phenol degradation
LETKDQTTGITETVDGFSDIQARLKINLWGNDGGKTALAFFPFVKIPTYTSLSNDHVEGGLILPFSLELNETMSLGLMPEVDIVHQEAGDGYDAEFVHTAVFGFDLNEKIGAFIEYVGVAGSGTEYEYQASTVVGITYSPSDHLQYDAGIRFGINDAAEDFGTFVGISTRF